MQRFFYLIIGVLSISTLIRCSKNDHLIGSNATIVTTNDVLGKWQITEYSDSGVVKTDDVSGISIQFNSDGAFSIFKEDSLFTGNWELQPVAGLDHLEISVSTQQYPYGIFDDDWLVVEKSTSTLNLANTSIIRKKFLNLQRQ